MFALSPVKQWVSVKIQIVLRSHLSSCYGATIWTIRIILLYRSGKWYYLSHRPQFRNCLNRQSSGTGGG